MKSTEFLLRLVKWVITPNAYCSIPRLSMVKCRAILVSHCPCKLDISHNSSQIIYTIFVHPHWLSNYVLLFFLAVFSYYWVGPSFPFASSCSVEATLVYAYDLFACFHSIPMSCLLLIMCQVSLILFLKSLSLLYLHFFCIRILFLFAFIHAWFCLHHRTDPSLQEEEKKKDGGIFSGRKILGFRGIRKSQN